MRLYIKGAGIILLTYACMLTACNEKQNKDPDEVSQPVAAQMTDTLYKNKIDTLVAEIKKKSIEIGAPVKIPFPLFVETDTIDYWKLDSNLAQISVVITSPDTIAWPTFYTQNGKIFFVRFRLWVPKYVSEELIYFKDDEIVFCSQRNMPIFEGAMPGLLKRQ